MAIELAPRELGARPWYDGPHYEERQKPLPPPRRPAHPCVLRLPARGCHGSLGDVGVPGHRDSLHRQRRDHRRLVAHLMEHRRRSPVIVVPQSRSLSAELRRLQDPMGHGLRVPSRREGRHTASKVGEEAADSPNDGRPLWASPEPVLQEGKPRVPNDARIIWLLESAGRGHRLGQPALRVAEPHRRDRISLGSLERGTPGCLSVCRPRGVDRQAAKTEPLAGSRSERDVHVVDLPVFRLQLRTIGNYGPRSHLPLADRLVKEVPVLDYAAAESAGAGHPVHDLAELLAVITVGHRLDKLVGEDDDFRLADLPLVEKHVHPEWSVRIPNGRVEDAMDLDGDLPQAGSDGSPLPPRSSVASVRSRAIPAIAEFVAGLSFTTPEEGHLVGSPVALLVDSLGQRHQGYRSGPVCAPTSPALGHLSSSWIGSRQREEGELKSQTPFSWDELGGTCR
jgi:hypothetical protein